MEFNRGEVTFKSDSEKNYMIIRMQGTADNYKGRMIAENAIPGLLRASISVCDKNREFLYDISYMQPIRKIFEQKKMKRQDLLNIVAGICTAGENIKKYLLDIKNIMFDTEMIYMNPESGKTCFVYNPYFEGEVPSQLRALSAYFLERVDYSDMESIESIYQFCEIVSKETFLLKDIETLFQKGMLQWDIMRRNRENDGREKYGEQSDRKEICEGKTEQSPAEKEKTGQQVTRNHPEKKWDGTVRILKDKLENGIKRFLAVTK